MDKMPGWADAVLVPLISILLAALVSSVVILAIGESPIAAFGAMVEGALATSAGWGYTLYYATNFMFTGLAVSVAFHARLFNIGGEGQVMLGGLGVALACLYIPWPHWTLAVFGSGLAAAAFGALWALIPAYLQAKRGSHIVITTIMFNFIASALLVYLLVETLKVPGSMAPETARFPEGARLPSAREVLAIIGVPFART
ncbi:MAG: ABC transporter permease, partial [Paracoccaceae bacterium]